MRVFCMYSVSVAAPRRLFFQFGRTDSYRVATIPLNYEDNKTADGRSKVFSFLKNVLVYLLGLLHSNTRDLERLCTMYFLCVYLENGGGQQWTFSNA